MALGDSYTIGEGVETAERWPIVLAARLRARGFAMAQGSAPEIVARTGWTIAELAAGIDAAKPQGPFDLVTLLIGVNDQYRGGFAEEGRERYRAMLERAISFAGGAAPRVIALSIPDWGVTPFAAGRDRAKIAAEIDRWNEMEQHEAEAVGVAWLDVTAISREAAVHTELVASDGLHPSAAMYARWVEQLLPLVERVFLVE